MTDLTPDQEQALAVAHALIDLGVPIFPAAPNHGDIGPEFHFPNAWQTWRPSHSAVDRWRPGWALCAVTGVIFDVIDIDPRNGGDDGWHELSTAGAIPDVYGEAFTPSQGRHLFIARTRLAKGKPATGIDLQAGGDDGEGRAFVFIAPTVRVSKFGTSLGQPVVYEWERVPTFGPGTHVDEGLGRLRELCLAGRPVARDAAARPLSEPLSDDWDVAEDWSPRAAEKAVEAQLTAVQSARAGEVNGALGGAARVLGRFIAGGWLDEEAAVARLLAALEAGGVHSDAWNIANRKDWTAASVIQRGMDAGKLEPWTVGTPKEVASTADTADISIRSDIGYPRMVVESVATMTYWLAQEAGRNRLQGFFIRGGQVVHTPRVTDLGYVPAPEGDNGPVEIRPVTGRQMASKIQFMYSWYKIIKGRKGEEDREVPAMFPIGSAEAVVNAPEAATGLRPLRGITHTPMVRADGSILSEAGYDKASGLLFTPGPGVSVPAVPEAPVGTLVESSVALLLEMIEGFPFATEDDRANYLGLLLTPLLRLIAPPSYKLFGIGAHQPGSGKSLLAEIVSIIHGAVTRSEVPTEEPEWGKFTMSLLAATSAPVVVLDNITGILRSSTLAGLLTASGEIGDRVLGSNTQTMTVINDRVWVATGNNLSLGGDMVRRTITILIDPDMVNPETRTDFKIQDLPAWVRANRSAILHALLVLVRHWVAVGMPLEGRAQSDGFTAWERTVGGILAAAGIPGRFDMESGKRVAAGGDDDGLVTVLQRLHDRFGDAVWTVAQSLEPDSGEWIEGDRDWLPAPVLDKLVHSEARGKQAFGKWLRFRLGRWVTGTDGRAYVLRDEGLLSRSRVQGWRVEAR